ncbi:hypothetical protein SNOG_16277 [Parastagonospora nodorum SN15]|uniref:Uncharacterized protein n=1 Tax=Phaeosphaeria nodorum (strain SN15 / ATCC MYA-4574 / FGSC 10173) TaxID=321614 RepID=Q0TVW1_PHANO|nr:hypothetical protein SNOG_16277 [Parastagonospora nodorum SN15]EAT76263.1 hypothetical protein SNOG_16277 [Parastagonospora nodorum SN15]
MSSARSGRRADFPKSRCLGRWLAPAAYQSKLADYKISADDNWKGGSTTIASRTRSEVDLTVAFRISGSWTPQFCSGNRGPWSDLYVYDGCLPA